MTLFFQTPLFRCVHQHNASMALWRSSSPVREELFSAERLEQHAGSLALAQVVTASPPKVASLTRRLNDNARVLLGAYRACAVTLAEGREVVPAAAWLLDNYHLIEAQIREIRGDLPPGYYRQLPKLAEGPFAGYPRVFGIAWAFIAHTDSNIELSNLRAFIKSYQRTQPLTIGELWAVAITLRIVLVENLRRLADQIITEQTARDAADALAAKWFATENDSPISNDSSNRYSPYSESINNESINNESVNSVSTDNCSTSNDSASYTFSSFTSQKTPLSAPFIAQLAKRLRGVNPHTNALACWLFEQLNRQGESIDDVVQSTQQCQGASNVTVRNIITSMRFISSTDWAELFESVSLVDAKLREHSRFAQYDFSTRNQYRVAVEELARGSAYTELEIVDHTLTLSREALPLTDDVHETARVEDPGYFLVAAGRNRLEKRLNFRPPLKRRFRQLLLKNGINGYVIMLTATTVALIVLAGWLLLSMHSGEVSSRWLLLLAALGILPTIEFATSIVNRYVIYNIGAQPLPSLDLSKGVPPSLRTLVAMPTLLTNEADLKEQLDRLEVHHLSSGGGAISYALLTDGVDAQQAELATDEALLSICEKRIEELNKRYCASSHEKRFFLLHRNRVYNAGEQCWMGWERKRGKLHELNKLLRGATDTTFRTPPSLPRNVHYILTLDADTRLPRGAASKLVGKIAHPLNHPRFDTQQRRVVEGYAILQPRVTQSMPTGERGSTYQQLCSSPGGIDPYAAAISDLYQDLVGDGSFAGKGIYNIDAFEASLAGRITENSLLSHDMFEGIFARAGLASDIEVIEDFPDRYDVVAKRQHRWVRGDWQLLPWLLTASLPPSGRLKILGNLRRSLLPPLLLACFAVSWQLPVMMAVVSSLMITMVISIPVLLSLITSFAPLRAGVNLRYHFHQWRDELTLGLKQILLQLMFLPDQAWRMLDAIVSTLTRVFITRRHLLEWTSSAQTMKCPHLTVWGFYRHMAPGTLLGIAVAFSALWFNSSVWLMVLPIALLWTAAPALATWLSSTTSIAYQPLIAEETARELRLIARRTWRYFETFVTTSTNLLPPDNFQEEPQPVVAQRTSPTNMGLYLLSILAARDFGWIGNLNALSRIETTLAVMHTLPRYRGHLFNWYAIDDLRPLNPRYVSTVDSGNLAGHLITLANALETWQDTTFQPDPRQALADTLALAFEALKFEEIKFEELKRASQSIEKSLPTKPLTEQLEKVATLLSENKTSPLDLKALTKHTKQALKIASDLFNGHHDCNSEDDNKNRGNKDRVNKDIVNKDRGKDDGEDVVFWVTALHKTAAQHNADHRKTSIAISAHGERLQQLASKARRLALSMDFAFLLNSDRQLLSIGFSLDDVSLDTSCYDLLASEARLASLFAIAKGDVVTRHWFRLGRAATPLKEGAAMISWSGSMFEYLMPSLIMRAPAGSLLEQTNRLVVKRQETYAAQFSAPWGISESGYNARDIEHTYQYSNFGVPGLGLKRGLSADLVVAPYATGLAAMIDPEGAFKNYRRLAEMGALGRYGYYEALDLTRSRLPKGVKLVIVRSYMAHHQGMTIVAIANTLHHGQMRQRFHREPMIQASELLLQERIPRDVAIAYPRAEEVKSTASQTINEAQTVRKLSTSVNGPPVTHLLSNGNYSVMLTATGGGYSRWHNLAITRWQPDTTRDHWGSFIFLRDTRRPSVWSATGQSLESHTSANDDDNHVLFAEDYARYVHRHEAISSHLDILVSGEDNSEVRLLTLANSGRQTCDIDVTTYAELVLTTPSTDNAHPSFAKMFVVTEYLPAFNALVATRRRRDPSEAQVWVAQFAVVEGDTVGDFQYETDREQFIGRGHRISAATALAEGQHLSGTVGSVIDPIFASRYCLRIKPGKAARIAYWTVVADSREALMDLIDKHHDVSAFERAKMLAWTQAQVQLRHLGTQPEEAADFQRLAAPLLYPDARFRAPQKAIQSGAAQQSLLWQHGISGDLPIVLLRIQSTDDLPQLHQLLRAHEYWRMKRLEVDVVIINERASSYIQDLQQAIEATILSSQSRPRLHSGDAQGTIYALRADLASAQSCSQLQSVARVVLIAHRGSIADQLSVMLSQQSTAKPLLVITKRALPRQLMDKTHNPHQFKRPTLEFFNGWGGFAKQGREYAIILEAGSSTPAPWINVIANQQFGFQVSAEGAGYLWADSSRENQLTPWSNDPVSDPNGDVIYVRDEETLALYTATASPIRDSGRYVARHGFGYSQFEHHTNELSLELLHFVPRDAPLRISRLRITNHSNKTRKLSVTAYAEWVLGTSRSASAPFLITSQSTESGALLVTNPWNAAFPGRVAFLDIGEQPTQWTGNRSEFIGYGKHLAEPAGLRCKTPLSGTLGAGLDPCAALQRPVTLVPGETVDIIVLLGQGGSNDEVAELIARFRDADIDAELANIHDHWNTQLNAIQVKTPDRAMDIMLNGWLLYQTIACRLTARSAFYQASGAYGFRDQLQDCMALTFSNAATTRQHLLRAASRQFPEGDVQHWWLPHSGQGVRTRISDDRVWLAYACARYLATTQDIAVLDEPVSFLDGAQLSSHEHEHFFQPTTSLEAAPLFEHCARGLDITLSQLGEHGLPLIGGGDWNDGMNRVGAEGKGESVWLGWLLLKTLHHFAPIAEQREAQACHADEPQRAVRWHQHAQALRIAIENSAWDGQWYRRATYDNGIWLGSKQSDACQIDSIAQSWAVLSGASDPERSTLAMHSLERELILHDPQLALLFWPPFDHPKQDPGYISGYPPGMRENGGQYSHASMWAILAFTQLGEGDKAHQLFTLLNPINHATTTEAATRYRVEPYVVAADVYSVAPHVGRGGWTWYTGAAGWMYQAGMEGILGIRREASWLVIFPCLPASWPHFSADITLDQSHYHIKVINAQASPAMLGQNLLSQTLSSQTLSSLSLSSSSQALTATLDGVYLVETGVGMPIRVPLDNQHHQLEIVIRRCAPA
ncbi:GH36-type glycosyl hydrolase domain-containing protein [Halomonas alkaliantarctica]|uniref:GH36-type glycosyl hydrolase domain-containing protein n=1 Tax=Halomonas alkaliantarctica TaxID=232346 RepID=UPI002659B622|nr:glucoamylase family protein [Halomonas alkaliantarctica]